MICCMGTEQSFLFKLERKVNVYMKRKITALLIAVCAVTLIGGCGGKENKNEEQNTTEGTEASGSETDASSYDIDE